MMTTCDLLEKREQAQASWGNKTGAELYITIGIGTCGLAAGAQETLAAVEAEIGRRGMTAVYGQIGCVGMCSYEPMVELQSRGQARVNYGNALAENIPGIFASHFEGEPLKKAVIVGHVVPFVAESGTRTLQSLSFVDPASGGKVAFHQIK